MTIHDPAARIRAAALLRGDLAELLPREAAGEVDARLHGAIVLAVTDPEAAAAVITAITATESTLQTRLASFERDLTADEALIAEGAAERPRGINGPPGNPGKIRARVWTCPADPPEHFRKYQRYPAEPMGACATHGYPLVPNDGQSA